MILRVMLPFLLMSSISFTSYAQSAPTPPAAATNSTGQSTTPANNDTLEVKITTNLGSFVVELDRKNAPVSVANFLAYADEGFYSDTVFHRVISNFMIQGGGFDASMNRKTTKAPIKNEAKNGLKNKVGTLAMARTHVPDSATSQFFINLSDNQFLDHGVRDFGYAVFGKVVLGMDVVKEIGKVPTSRKGMHQNVPNTPIIIKGIERLTPSVNGSTSPAEAQQSDSEK